MHQMVWYGMELRSRGSVGRWTYHNQIYDRMKRNMEPGTRRAGNQMVLAGVGLQRNAHLAPAVHEHLVHAPNTNVSGLQQHASYKQALARLSSNSPAQTVSASHSDFQQNDSGKTAAQALTMAWCKQAWETGCSHGATPGRLRGPGRPGARARRARAGSGTTRRACQARAPPARRPPAAHPSARPPHWGPAPACGCSPPRRAPQPASSGRCSALLAEAAKLEGDV